MSMKPRQFCCQCLTTTTAYRTEEHRPFPRAACPVGRRFHFCLDIEACAARRAKLEGAAQ